MLRFGFITCVQLGLSCLEELVNLDANLVYLGTLEDDLAPHKSGRVRLDAIATSAGIPLHKFRHVNDPDTVAGIEVASLDWLFIIGWSQMAGPRVLHAPRRGVLGIHPTLLPQGRGRASIPWAIIKGLRETGVTMFKLDEGMDTGPILGQVRIPVEPTETSTSLYGKAVDAHRVLIRDTYPRLKDGTITMRVQDEAAATEWPGRRPGDGELDLTQLDAHDVDRHVRALTRPYPGAYVRADDRLLRIWHGAIGELPDGIRLSTREGIYTATDFEWEDSA